MKSLLTIGLRALTFDRFDLPPIAKHQRRWDGFDEMTLAPYARGMTTRDTQSFLRKKYGIDVLPEFISSV